MAQSDKEIKFIKRCRVSELKYTVEGSNTSYMYINPDAINYCLVDTLRDKDNCELLMNNGDTLVISLADYKELVKE